jgi:hypothetical protein
MLVECLGVSKGRVLLIALGVVTVITASWLLIVRRQPEVMALPEDAELEEVTALLYERDGWGSPVPEFALPRDYIPPVLAALRPAERNEYPHQWDEWCTVGRLRIRCQGGRVIEVTWPDSGKNCLCFQVDGQRCVRGGEYLPTSIVTTAERQEGIWSSECVLLANVVREGYQEAMTGERSSRARGYFEDLERSAGRMPPHSR